MNKENHILLINYDFPSNQGIGGRRWAKFAKQLAIRGYKVHVIKADEIAGNVPSPWTDDVKHENISVHSIPRIYPQAFSHPRQGLIAKIAYKYHRLKLRLTERGTIYDISIGWEQVLQKMARELIEKFAIRNVIASGAPWKMLYYTAHLKEFNPALNLIIDYRDPWLNARNYGMANLSPKRRQEEERKQKFIFEHADVITTPYEYLTDELRGWSKERCSHQPEFNVLTHFFDPADIPVKSSLQNNKLILLYGGDLYLGMEEELRAFETQLRAIKKMHPELYARLEVRIFTDSEHPGLFEDLDIVTFNHSIGKRIFDEMNNASFCMIILPSNKRHDRTTKFYESLPFRKPFLVIAPEGEVSAFVRKNNLGYIMSTTHDSLAEILLSAEQEKNNFDKNFDITPYSLPGVALQLTTYFK